MTNASITISSRPKVKEAEERTYTKHLQQKLTTVTAANNY